LKTISLFIALLCSQTFAAGIDLHSHPFMKHGIGPLFQGSFFTKTRSTSYKTMLKSNLNEQTLLESDINILVVALYTHPILSLFSGGPKKSIDKQIDEAEVFIQRNPDWIIAKSSQEASSALKEGKRVLILSLEGAENILESEDDLNYFINERGISIVTPIHLSNTHFGGAAYMRGFRKTFLNLSKLISPLRSEGVVINFKGITKKGHWLLDELIKRQVWIDLTHGSDLYIAEAMKKIKAAKHPYLFTHTALRKYYKAERGLANWMIEEIKTHEAMVGLVPSEEMIIDTVAPSHLCPENCQSCDSGTRALAAQFLELSSEIGASNIALGQDFNGGIAHLSPDKCDQDSEIDEKSGYYLFSQDQALNQKVQSLGLDIQMFGPESTKTFLRLWTKVRKSSKSK
jgi:microsomal dipeptidase-like Zn-dependent dipeptidase